MAGLVRGDRGSSRCDGLGQRKETASPPFGVTFREKKGSVTHRVWTMGEECETEMAGECPVKGKAIPRQAWTGL